MSSITPQKRKPNHPSSSSVSGKTVKKQVMLTPSTPLQKPRKKSEISLPPTPSTEVPEEKNKEEEPTKETKQAEEEEEEEEEDGIIADDDFKELMQIHGRSKEELKALLDNFSEEQLQRYEVYRRSALNKSVVKKLVGNIINQQISPTMAFVVAGFAKVFVGEMVEKAKEVMEAWGDKGPIRPHHLREAYRQYDKETGLIPSVNYQKRLFRR